jgi:hypothetical protein
LAASVGYDKLWSGGMAEIPINLARLPEADVRPRDRQPRQYQRLA